MTTFTTLAISGGTIVLLGGALLVVGSMIFQKIQEDAARARRQGGSTGMGNQQADSIGGLSPEEREAARRRREEIRARIQRGPGPATEVRVPQSSTESAPTAGSDLERAREEYRRRAEQLRREREAVSQKQTSDSGERQRAEAAENARAANAAREKAEIEARSREAADRSRREEEELKRQRDLANAAAADSTAAQPAEAYSKKKATKPAATAKPTRAFSLRQAMIWKEILDPPVSMRE